MAANFYVIEGGKSEKNDAAAQVEHDIQPWISEDGQIDPELLVADIEEHEVWLRQLRVSRDMRKTILRCLVLKSGKLSMKVGEQKVILVPRKDLICSEHRVQPMECACKPEELRLEMRVIDDPAQRDVRITKAKDGGDE